MGTINDEEELQHSLEEGQKETQLLIHEQACNGQTKQHHVVLSNSAADDPNPLYSPPFTQTPYDIRRSSSLLADSGRKPGSRGDSKPASTGPCKCCSCCTWKCCAISQSVILCIIGAILLTGMGLAMYKMQKSGKVKAKYEAKAEAFEKKLAIQNNMNVTEDMANKNWMNGTYELEGFDKNYQPFMEAFGIPSFVVSFILGAEETFIVTIAENKKTVHFKTIMGGGVKVKEREITLDRLEEVEWGEGRGIMHINCSLPKENVLACDAQERIRNWDVSREYIFSKLGIVSTRTFHTKSISAKKYYKRVGVQLSSEEMDERMPLKEDMIRIEKGEESEDPFGDDEDDDW